MFFKASAFGGFAPKPPVALWHIWTQTKPRFQTEDQGVFKHG